MSGLLRIFYMQMQAAKVRTGSTHKKSGEFALEKADDSSSMGCIDSKVRV